MQRNPDLEHIRFHDLRHTSATLLFNAGVHVKIIQERLVHLTIATYGHLILEADQTASDLFRKLFKNKKMVI